MDSNEAERSVCPYDLSPETRQYETATGTPLILGDGKEWLMPDLGLSGSLRDLRSKIYTDNVMTGEVDPADLMTVAYYGIKVNYELSDDEATWLVNHAYNDRFEWLDKDFGAITQYAILPIGDRPRDFDSWALGSLYANGLDPAAIPPPHLPIVLQMLVATGRAIPHSQFTAAAQAASKIGLFRSMVQPKPEA